MIIFTPTLIFSLAGVVATLCYWAYNFIIVYHLTRFSVGTMPKRLAALYLLGSAMLFSVCVILFVSIDFSSLMKWLSFFQANGFLKINR